MNIKFEKIAQKGELPTLNLFIDGDLFSKDHGTSRKLTGTYQEDGAGVLCKTGGQKSFSKTSGENVNVEILPINVDLTAQQNLSNLVANIKAVKKAFKAKYPAIYEVAEIDI